MGWPAEWEKEGAMLGLRPGRHHSSPCSLSPLLPALEVAEAAFPILTGANQGPEKAPGQPLEAGGSLLIVFSHWCHAGSGEPQEHSWGSNLRAGELP